MSVIRIASRYAKSLIDLAVEQDKLERVLEDIKSFQKATGNREFYLLLKSPIINATKKQQIFNALFEGKFDEMTSAFIKIILTKGRETYLPEIADEFVNQYKVIKQISTVKLTTAAPLGAETVSRIKQKLVASSETDAHVELITKVNPDIIGGFVIEFDDKLYDSSVTHKMELLRKEFAKNEFVKNF
jgi:F-type H+-transporting ATPase subunit delta